MVEKLKEMGKRDKKPRHQQRRAAFHYTEEDDGDGDYEGHSASKLTVSEDEEEEEEEAAEEEVAGEEVADECPSTDMPSKFLLYQQSVQVRPIHCCFTNPMFVS